MTNFSADITRYNENGDHGKEVWLNPAVWAVASYRLSNWVYGARPFLLVRLPLKALLFLTNKFCEVFMQMCISPQASIGEGLYIGHVGGVHISQYAVIGKNCDISHRVTIGVSGMGRKGVPVLGDNVYVGPGSTLVGKIRIGDGARIAANTLVLDDVPAGATVMGVPGRVMVAPPRPVQAPPVPATASAEPSVVAEWV
jgi:serine O-acetyltransferase